MVSSRPGSLLPVAWMTQVLPGQVPNSPAQGHRSNPPLTRPPKLDGYFMILSLPSVLCLSDFSTRRP